MHDANPDLARFLRDELGIGAADAGRWEVAAPLWRWQAEGKDAKPGATSWFFLTIDGAVAERIRAASAGRTAAWGSAYVTARIGETEWRTSLFPSKNVKGYLLPVKAAVRRAQSLNEGDIVAATLQVG